MIRLISGLPGAGKSLRGVQVIRQFLAEGRPVYVHGIDGLQPFGWEDCANPRDWQSLPDGSVVVVDEAQKVWPTRSGSAAIPDDVRALSEHRHRGFDFVLLTQHPTMLDSYVRKLIGQHEHVIRQFGMQAARIVTWTECQDDPQSLGTRQRGTDALWKYPQECYALYKSATMHTVKRRIPFRVAMIPVLVVVVAVLAWWGTSSVSSMGDAPSFGGDVAAVSSGVSGIRPSAGGGQLRYASPEEYAAAFVPRLPAMPWSAPAFDGREVVSRPEILCVWSESKGCRCYTEQVTRLDVPMLQCIRIARDGVYNPFRAPLESTPAAREGEGTAGAVSAAPTYETLPVPRYAPASLTREPLNMGSAWPR